MKLVTLNIMQGGGTRVPVILDYFVGLDADVLVLTELRANTNAALITSRLADRGFSSFASASDEEKLNSVGIFSRLPFESVAHPYVLPDDRHRLVSAQFSGMSVYGAYFAQRKEKATLFNCLMNDERRLSDEPFFILGDFNTGHHFLDEPGKSFYCAAEFKGLSTSGLIDSWRTRNPEAREASWFSNTGNGFRIDHVFSNPAADSTIARIYYDHEPRQKKMTDHSALIVETTD